MRLKIKGHLSAYHDQKERIPLFAPDERLMEIVVDNLNELSAGRFRLNSGDPAFSVPFGTVAAPAVLKIWVEGLPGANISLSGGTALQLRPPSTTTIAADDLPSAVMLQTVSGLTSVTITHPGGTEPIEGYYALAGDAVP